MKRLRTMLCLAILLLGAVSTRAEEPLRIRVSWVFTPSELTPILFAKDGIPRHLGKSYELVPVRYSSSSLMIQALASGELDIAALTFFSFANAVGNAGLDDLRIVADEFQDGAPGYFSGTFLVRNDGGIRTVEDLKGKVVASSGIGSLGDIASRVMLRKHGLEDKRDYAIVEAQPFNQKAMLLEAKVDLSIALSAPAFDPELSKSTHALFTIRDALGPVEGGFLTARAGTIAAQRAAYVDFFEDMVRSVRWYFDPANHDEALAIAAAFTKFPRDQLGWAFTHDDEYHPSNGRPDMASLQRIIDTVNQLGFLKTRIDVANHADLSLVDEAVQRLK